MATNDWTFVRDTLAQEIAEGVVRPGDRIPTEPELARRFGVGRHSLRRAIAELAKQGKLSVEQGRGTFVGAPQMLHYELGKRTRLRQNLSGQCVDITRELIEASVIPAPEAVRLALDLAPGALVSHARRITVADGVPIAFGAGYHAVDRFPGYLERREVFGSVTETYRSYGIEDYIRRETTLFSRQAQPDEAKVLRQHPDLSVTIIHAIDALPDGTPIAFSEVIWAASRVRFTILSEPNDQD
jgi:GntR family transcriptional regulator, phosphonate transport system regulatory protein